MEDASLLQERVAVVIDQVMVEPRERPVVAKGIPRGRVTAPTIVDPVERRVGSEGNQARLSRTKAIAIGLAEQLCHGEEW